VIWGRKKPAYSQLEELNPWLRDKPALFGRLAERDWLALGEAGDDEMSQPAWAIRNARRRAHWVRLEEGTEAWNRWALAMLDLAAEESGNPRFALAIHADFGNHLFETELDLRGLIFPGPLTLDHALLLAGLRATEIAVYGEASLRRIDVTGDVCFDGSRLMGGMSLRDSRFSGRFSAGNLQVDGILDARNARFGQAATFGGGRFCRRVRFSGSVCGADIAFTRSEFEAACQFDNAEIAGATIMDDCRFADAVDFRESRLTRPLFARRAHFADDPLVEGAELREVPQLEGAVILNAKTGQGAAAGKAAA
jgi:hypothetical protein